MSNIVNAYGTDNYGPTHLETNCCNFSSALKYIIAQKHRSLSILDKLALSNHEVYKLHQLRALLNLRIRTNRLHPKDWHRLCICYLSQLHTSRQLPDSVLHANQAVTFKPNSLQPITLSRYLHPKPGSHRYPECSYQLSYIRSRDVHRFHPQ